MAKLIRKSKGQPLTEEKKPTLKGQKGAVLKHFENHEALTSKEAFEKYGITRISGVIFALRDKGYNITTTMVEGTTRYGTRSSYAEYRLED
jgi:hypothetical protein